LTFTGSEGTMEVASGSVTISRTPREKEPGYTINTFTNDMQKRTLEQYRQKYPLAPPAGPTTAALEKFVAPKGYNDTYDHFQNFFAAVRSRKPVVEDAEFGFRAAGAALLSNLSIER